jgi:TolB-like protein/tetratricopeptide (TPR) repeat protein
MTDAWTQLKQRKLVQWAVAYVAAVFALLQGIDIVAQRFGWPDSVERILIIVSCIGFFVTLLLAWYHGERGAQKVSVIELVILAAVLAVGGGLLWRYAGDGGARSEPTLLASAAPVVPAAPEAKDDVDPKSIAVLPFTAMSAGKDDVYFAEGLSEETINALSRVPDLRVAARTSSFAFRNSGKTVPQIAHALHVATVLEGSVRRAGDHLRMSAQLIRAADGFELWSETYDRSSSDVIAIQEDVARSIAQALKTATDPKALAAMQRTGTHSVPAYQAYLRGLALMQQAGQEGNFTLTGKALAAFNQATEIDPDFADAYASAADLESGLLQPTNLTSERLGTSADYARRLQQLRADLDRAAAHARTQAQRYYYRALSASSRQQFVAAAKLMRLYVREYPKSSQGYAYVAQWSLYQGDYKAASAAIEAEAQSIPDPDVTQFPLGVLVMAGSFRRAEHFARIFLRTDPDNTQNIFQVHRALLSAGAISEAAKLMPQLMASGLGPATKALIRIRQACAEGRYDDAHKLYQSMASIDDRGVISRWQALQLLGRPRAASRGLAFMDTPVYFNALSGFLWYPYFDVSRYPNLQKVLLAQGIHRPPPRRPPFACKLQVETP